MKINFRMKKANTIFQVFYGFVESCINNLFLSNFDFSVMISSGSYRFFNILIRFDF